MSLAPLLLSTLLLSGATVEQPPAATADPFKLVSTARQAAEKSNGAAPAAAPAPGAAAAPKIRHEKLIEAPAGVCELLPKPRSGPPPFPAGELLSYDLDVMGAKAGVMTFEVLPKVGRGSKAQIPVRVRAESNTFFSKVRKVKAELVSHLRAKDLHPVKFHEDLNENDFARTGDVEFHTDKKVVMIGWRSKTRTGSARAQMSADALDYIGAIYLFRSIPLKTGQTFCFDVYSMRRMWRVEGKVEAREHLSTPAGEFNAFHLSGVATRIGGTPLKREVHVWISDDAARLPIAAMGVIDLGPVRAVLSSISRPDFKSQPSRPSTLEW